MQLCLFCEAIPKATCGGTMYICTYVCVYVVCMCYTMYIHNDSVNAFKINKIPFAVHWCPFLALI